MCDCDRALELLSLELDGELNPEEKGELEAHLAACEECRGAAEELRQLHTILPELEEEVPDGLHQAIIDRIGAEKVVPLSRVSKKSHIQRWASLAAVFAVILLGAGTLKTLQSGGSTATAPAAASVTTAEATQDTADAAVGEGVSGGAEQPETDGKSKEEAVSNYEEALPAESAPVLVQDDAEENSSGGAALRMSPPASAQPTPTPTPAAEDSGSSQERANQAITFSVMPAEAATNDGAVQPDADTTETLRANCTAWLADSTFDQKDRVDTTLVSVAQVTEGDLAAAVCDDESAALLDAADWAVTLGDTTGHDYAVLLCDSETLAVLGYVPIA